MQCEKCIHLVLWHSGSFWWPVTSAAVLASDGELKAGHPAIQSWCHSGEGGTAATSFLTSGVRLENRKKSISDPDQLHLCVTYVCLKEKEDKRSVG